MATVSITLCVTNARIQQQPVVDDIPVDNEVITSSGASQATAITASSLPGNDMFWCVAASGGPVWATFDETPVADAGVTWLVADGATLWLRATPGNKCAIIDA